MNECEEDDASDTALPPEQIQRCKVLVSEEMGGCLLNTSLKERVEIEEVKKAAPVSALLKVHDVNYVMKIAKAAATKVR